MTPGQQILAKLLIESELLNEKQCANVFKQVPEPEEALARLVKGGHLSDRVGAQLLEMFRQRWTAHEKSTAPAATENKEATAAQASATPATAAAPVVTKPKEPAVESQATAAPAVAAKAVVSRPDIPHDATGVQLLRGILKKARELKASDVHITSGLPPVLRINTRLVEMEMPPMPAESTLKALCGLLDDERRRHFLEHKDLDFSYDGGPDLGRFRTNFLMEQNGACGVFRLISPKVPTLDELGMPEIVKKFTTYAVGIVLLTGPKGCGKTTTLASMLDLVNTTRAEHIITIEDPIEFVHPCKKAHINQREVGTHTKSFAAALRAALREAPNVIMVGEMRDLETTSLAVTAAETGHLVVATLHTPDAIRTIGRVLDVFPPHEQGQIRSMLSESLRGVVSQQLVPSADGKSLHLALEILVNTSAIANMIREDRSFQLRGVMQTGRRLGMMLMDDSLLKLVQEGKIDPQEAILRAADPEVVTREIPKVLQAKKAQAAK